MAALGFVPWIAFFAVVPGAYVVDAFDALVDHAGVEHESGCGVFEAGHDFGEVGKWNARAGRGAIVADDHGCFVVQGEGALDVVMIVEASFVVVAIDGVEGLARVFRRDEGTEAGDVSQILAEQLIDEAAAADLVFRDFGVVAAEAADELRSDLVFGIAFDLLLIELALEEIGVDPRAALGKELAMDACAGVVSGGAGHLFGGAQGSEIVDAAEWVGAVELDVVGGVLNAVEDPSAIRIPATGDPCEFKAFPDARPHGLEPCVVA